MVAILGISAYYHDSAAALVVDGDIVAAAQQERFSRKKHDAGFPRQAVAYCLSEAGLSFDDLAHVVFYDKPLLKFERLLETYLSFAPRGLQSFVTAMPVWLKEKLYLKRLLKIELANVGGCSESNLPQLLFTEHHQSHAASAFFPSPFQNAAVLCLDGVGEWATTSVWIGAGNRIRPIWEVDFPHSLGLLYSAFTYYCGFKVNSGEYKLMGLAPYGEPRYVDRILDNLLDLKSDGTFRLDMRYFDFATGLTMTNSRFARLFGVPARAPESALTQFHMDIARSIQEVTEEIVLRLGKAVRRDTGERNICLAGGVALNCVANGKLRRSGVFDRIWVQPAAGDAGGALGAALAVWHEYLAKPRHAQPRDAMKGSYLGPAYTPQQVRKALDALGAVYDELSDDILISRVARLVAEGHVVGWFQGRMEFGPRALGGRSIIGDPRDQNMQSTMNLKIKYRESFRPFAPSVLAERVGEYFDDEEESPYMLDVSYIHESLRLAPRNTDVRGLDRLAEARSRLPAITHVDYSARVQTVHRDTCPRYHRLISTFEELTGCPVVINTSFNVRGEPIVCSPVDAFRCFMRTEMDYLVIENCLLDKKCQHSSIEARDWREEFSLD